MRLNRVVGEVFHPSWIFLWLLVRSYNSWLCWIYPFMLLCFRCVFWVRSWWFHHHGSRPRYWTSLSDPVRTMSTERITEVRQHSTSATKESKRMWRKRDWSVAQSWPAAAGTSSCSRELQNDPTPWIMTRWWQKWRRRGCWWCGCQPWGRSIARWWCGRCKSNWRARRRRTTEKEKGLTKNGPRQCRSSTKA